MVDTLGLNVPAFEGAIGHVRCFAHVVNLVAKSLLRQFDVPKARAEQVLDEEDRALYELAEEDEEAPAAVDGEDLDPVGAGGAFNPPSALNVDDEDGWVDEIAAMTDEERAQFQTRVRPVRMTLTKVRHFVLLGAKLAHSLLQIRHLAFKLVNSSTILLPAWKKRVSEAGLPERVMPRDVATRWNSTYNMLVFAIKYRVVVDAICADRELGLRKFELTTREWAIASQLADTLKVRVQTLSPRCPGADHIRSCHLTSRLLPRHLSLRSSRMRPPSSRAELRISPPSSRPWT